MNLKTTLWTLAILSGLTNQLWSQVTLSNVAHTNNGGSAFAVAVSGNYAYLANYDDGLRIYDVSNPSNPINVGHTNNSATISASFQDIAVEGRYVFLANANDGMRIYDVIDPANPINIGHTTNIGELRSYAIEVAVSSNYVYLANGTDGLRICDVSDPANPSCVNYTNWFYCDSVAFADDRLYLRAASSLWIYDVSSPASPVLLGSNSLPIVVEEMVVLSNRLYMAAGGSGLRIYDVSNPASANLLGAIDNGGAAKGIAISNNYLYLANWNDGLRVYDVSDPANPVNVGHINDGGFAHGVALSGHHVLLANGSDGLRVYGVQPQLKIETTNPGDIVFTWPATAAFALQQSSDLSSPLWETLTNEPIAFGSSNRIVLPVPAGSMFYRLVSE